MRAAFAVLLILAGTTTAEPPQIGYFFDPAGTQVHASIASYTQATFYLVAFDTGPFTGWEASGTLSDPSWTLLGVNCVPAPNLDCPFEPWNYVVGLGRCLAPANSAQALLHYQIMYLAAPQAPADVTICVGPATPSSFGGLSAGYASCESELVALRPFEHESARFPDGCAVINCSAECPIAIGSLSVGAIKARH